MYNPKRKEEQYLELYNRGYADIALGGWNIEAVNYTFPPTVVIKPGQYLVVAKDPVALKKAYTSSVDFLGPFSGSLSNSGELVKLRNDAQSRVYEVDYKTNDPWSPLANGFGCSLELICYDDVEEETHPKYWYASTGSTNPDYHAERSGTPGKAPWYKGCPKDKLSSPYKLLFSEIFYKPIQKITITELREFIEIYNAGEDVDMSYWRLLSDSMVRFTFAPGTILQTGEYLLVYKDLASIKTVWGTISSKMAGPYKGELGNSMQQLAIVDRNGFVVEYLEYDDDNGWPRAPDALGASEDYLSPDSPGFNNYDAWRGKGYSLSRNSFEWGTNEAYNWRASFASPGEPNVLPTLRPSIVNHGISPDPKNIFVDTEVKVWVHIRPKIETDHIIAGTLVWYKDDPIFKTPISVKYINMTWDESEGEFSAVLPKQAVNSIIRYRFEVTTTVGFTLVHPFRLSPMQYHAYFVHPPPAATGTPTWYMFIERRDWGKLFEYMNGDAFAWQNNRVIDGSSGGCAVRPEWDYEVPAVIVIEGQVVDIFTRYQGSPYARIGGENLASWPGIAAGVGPIRASGAASPLRGWSFKAKLPRYAKWSGHSNFNLFKMVQGCTMTETTLAHRLEEEYGVGTCLTGTDYVYVRVNVNGFYYRLMMIKATDQAETINDLMIKNCPDKPMTVASTFYTGTGTGNVGPYGPSDFSVLSDFCGYSDETRYEYSYRLVSEKEWNDLTNMKKFVKQNWKLWQCGDGVLNNGEACDHGMGPTVYDASKRPDCSYECVCNPGYKAVAGKTTCIAVTSCGNGVVDAGESCDGGFKCDRCQCPPGYNGTGTGCSLITYPTDIQWPDPIPGGYGNWLRQKVDMNFMMSYTVLAAFAGADDQTVHNQKMYQRWEDKKWTWLAWDADYWFQRRDGNPLVDIYLLKGQGVHYLRGTVMKFLQPEFETRMRLFVATIFSDASLQKHYDYINQYMNLQDVRETPGGWNQDVPNCLPNNKVFIQKRRDLANSVLGTWAAKEGGDPWAAFEEVKCGVMPDVIKTYNLFRAPPGDIFEHDWHNKTSSSVELTWLPPHNWGSPILSYSLEYTITDISTLTRAVKTGSATLGGNATSFVIPNPGPTKTIILTLTPKNALGTGKTLVIDTDTPTDCVWSPWSRWSACSVSCGTGGTQHRSRVHAIEASDDHGLPCIGNTTEMQSCWAEPCPINCVWGNWSDWSHCDALCGPGKMWKQRTIKTVAQYGGADCVGNATTYANCTGTSCPVDCTLSDWSDWAECSFPCGSGWTSRTRVVTKAAAFGGSCSNELKQTVPCNTDPCPTDTSEVPPGSAMANDDIPNTNVSHNGMIIGLAIGGALLALIVLTIGYSVYSTSSGGGGGGAASDYQNL